MSLRPSSLVLATLALVLAAAPLRARGADALDRQRARAELIAQRAFVEIPGVQELTTRLIVRPVQPDALARAGLSEDRVEARRAAARERVLELELVRHVPQTDDYVVEVPAGRDPLDVALELLATGDYEYVDPDLRLFPVGGGGGGGGGGTRAQYVGGSANRPGTVTTDFGCPDDPLFFAQWHHQFDVMESCDAWQRTTGTPDIGIGICDTGVRLTHEELQEHRLEGYNAVDMLWESEGGNVSPGFNHGTRTTGVAVASGNNGLGVAGVGYGLSHRMLRVSNLGDGSAYLADIQHGARTSIESGDRVASVSYHGVYLSSNVPTAEYIRSIGGLMVWSAGNTSANYSFSNRDDDALLVVGATNALDDLAWFSVHGTFVDLVAPGTAILTTNSSGDSAYTSVEGTSYSCPIASAACALIWSQNPDLSPADVEAILKQSAEDIGAPGVDDVFGYGRINLRRALDLTGEDVPVAELTAAPFAGRAPLTTQLRDQSTGVPTSWSWGFGDGTTSTERHPLHTYTTPGVYTVSLSVGNALGTDSVTRVDYVEVDVFAPVADFAATPSGGLAPLFVSFTDESGGGTPDSWLWDFGDGTTSTLQNPTHTYTTSGFYTVSFTCGNAYGNDTLVRTDHVAVDLVPPVADFSASVTSGASPLLVTFADESVLGGVPTQWLWNFGDGYASTQQNPSHPYTAAGTYSVSLTATNAYGSDQLVRAGYVTILPGPEILADFTAAPTTGTAPLQVDFTDLSVGHVALWEWNFGDDVTSTEQHPTHVYTAPGEYDVALSVTTAGGTDASLELQKFIVVE